MADGDPNPKWLELAAKLKKVADELKKAVAAHATAVRDPKVSRDDADAALTAVVSEAAVAVEAAANTPPGTFPAINQ
ncbi:MAG: hypothetical protein ABWY07_01750 [Burkholderiales bacterium]|jgi:hypothetical protein